MKSMLMMAVIAAAMLAQAEVKIGTVDIRVLLRNHRLYDTNKELLMSTEKKCAKRCDVIKGDIEAIQAKGKNLADEYKNPMLAEAAKAKIETELVEIQKKYAELTQQLRSEMMRSQQEVRDLEGLLLKKQTEDLRRTVAEFAKAMGYTYIIDSAAALYAAEGTDVTDGVLKTMGVDPAKAVRPDAEMEENNNEGK